MGRPLQIDDDDCDVEFPSAIEEERGAKETGPESRPNPPSTPSPLLLNIEILRCVGQVSKARKMVVNHDPLISVDAHFEACMAFRLALEPESVIDPRSAAPVISIQNTRLVLHRQNLSPVNSFESRRTALDNCLAISRDTARFLSPLTSTGSPRAVHSSNTLPDPKALVPVASALFCTHIWRCTLFLCFRGYYREAQYCARVSAANGDLRAVNSACGRHLAFLISLILERRQRERSESNEMDEEMLAYVSGDLQGDPQVAWVWQTSSASVDQSVGNTLETPAAHEPEARRPVQLENASDTGVTLPSVYEKQAESLAEPRPPVRREILPATLDPAGQQHQYEPSASLGRADDPNASAGSWDQVLRWLNLLIMDEPIGYSQEQSPSGPIAASAAVATAQIQGRTPSSSSSFNRISIANII